MTRELERAIVSTRSFGAGLTGTALSSYMLMAGLFTVSWDRFAQASVGSFNVKLPTVLFALALVLTLADSVAKRTQLARSPILAWALVVIAIFGAVGLFARNIVSAEVQTAVNVLGALIPFLAIFLNVRMYPNQLDRALTAFIRGGWFAAGFGLYQLAAFYTGLPQVVEYEAQGGGLGRISAFSYESGYFGYFMILVIAALYSRAALRSSTVPGWQLVFLVGVLLLANSRATFLTLPLLFVFLFFAWPKKVQRNRLWPLLVLAAWAAVVVLLVFPALFTVILERASTLLDPTEASSNAPRLSVLATVSEIIADYPLLGIGGGNLVDYYSEYGGAVGADTASNSFVANNMWYQALLDGGVVLLAIQVIFAVVSVAVLFRRKRPVSRALIAGWLAVVLPASLVTSYFYDMKLWAVLALAAAASTLTEERRSSEQQPIERA